MSRTRTRTPIEEAERIAREEGLGLEEDGQHARRWAAFDRVYRVACVAAGKNGLFQVTASGAEGPVAESVVTRDRLRGLMRASVARGGADDGDR